MLNKNDPLIGAVQEVMKKNQAERDAVRLVNEIFGVTDRKALPHERQGEWDAAYKTVLTEGVEALNELSPETLENYKDKRTTQVHATLRNMINNWQRKKTGKGASNFIKNSAEKAAKHAEMIKLAGDKIDGKKGVVPANRPKKRLEEESLDEKLVGNQHRIDANKNGRVDGHDFKLLKKGVRPVSEGEAPKTDPYAEGQASSISTVSQPKKEVTPADQAALKKKIMSIKEARLEEKAVSKAQHRFFGLVRGIQKGKAHGSAEAEKAAASMSAKSVKDYAKTKEKGLPEKVSEEMRPLGNAVKTRLDPISGSGGDAAKPGVAGIRGGAGVTAYDSGSQVKHQTQYGTRPGRTIGGGGRTDGSTYTQGKGTLTRSVGTGAAPAGGPPSGTSKPAAAPKPIGTSAAPAGGPPSGTSAPKPAPKPIGTSAAPAGGPPSGTSAPKPALMPGAQRGDQPKPALMPGAQRGDQPKPAKPPMGANAAPPGGPPSGTSAPKPAAAAPKAAAPKAAARPKTVTPVKKPNALQQQMARSKSGRDEPAGPRKDARGLNVHSMTRPQPGKPGVRK